MKANSLQELIAKAGDKSCCQSGPEHCEPTACMAFRWRREPLPPETDANGRLIIEHDPDGKPIIKYIYVGWCGLGGEPGEENDFTGDQ